MPPKIEKIHEFEVVFDPNGEGYTVTVPKLPGLVTEGNSLREAREMAKDAIRCYLESLLKDEASFVNKSEMRRKERVRVTA